MGATVTAGRPVKVSMVVKIPLTPEAPCTVEALTPPLKPAGPAAPAAVVPPAALGEEVLLAPLATNALAFCWAAVSPAPARVEPFTPEARSVLPLRLPMLRPSAGRSIVLAPFRFEPPATVDEPAPVDEVPVLLFVLVGVVVEIALPPAPFAPPGVLPMAVWLNPTDSGMAAGELELAGATAFPPGVPGLRGANAALLVWN